MICTYFLLAYDLSFQSPSQCSVKTNGDISNFAECNLSFFAFMGCAFTIYYTVNFFSLPRRLDSKYFGVFLTIQSLSQLSNSVVQQQPQPICNYRQEYYPVNLYL